MAVNAIAQAGSQIQEKVEHFFDVIQAQRSAGAALKNL